jgi:hypothetical protein
MWIASGGRQKGSRNKRKIEREHRMLQAAVIEQGADGEQPFTKETTPWLYAVRRP